MPRGKQQQLVTAILTAKFRPDRQGGLLLDDELPDEMPVEGSEEARESWASLVALQKGYVTRGIPHPWEFATAVRAFHTALARSQLFPWTRSMVLFDLDTGCRDFSDEELARHWDEWAQHEKDWEPSTFAHMHFIEGVPADEARRELFRTRSHARLA